MKKFFLAALILIVLPSVYAQGSGNGSLVDNIDPRNYVEIESAQDQDVNSTEVFNPERGFDLPPAYVGLILALLGIVIYSVDMDPFWIVSIMLLIVFSGIVYYLGFPIYIVPVVAILVLGVKHFR